MPAIHSFLQCIVMRGLIRFFFYLSPPVLLTLVVTFLGNPASKCDAIIYTLNTPSLFTTHNIELSITVTAPVTCTRTATLVGPV